VLAQSTSSHDDSERDPALQEMQYDVGDGPQTSMVYVEPDLNSFYNINKDDTIDSDDQASTTTTKSYSRVEPEFNGFGGKFINMSNKYLDFHWEDEEDGDSFLIAHFTPFESNGLGTYPGHRFYLVDPEEPDVRLTLWIVEDYPENIYVYDPYYVEDDEEQTEKNLRRHLDRKERSQYDRWEKTILYNEAYLEKTGRSYLANYGDQGPRAPPMHHMWRADYFGQQHWVTTRETHFVKLPEMSELGDVTEQGSQRVLQDSDPRHFQDYRTMNETTQEPLEYLNMTLTVLSCAPRVFEIQNFLSPLEVQHILELAGGISLHRSMTGDTDTDNEDTNTRTSRNSWVSREKSSIIDTIYRRAADLTRIDEALLRTRSPDELKHITHQSTLAEPLQLVHYDLTQEYTAHHDFGYSHIDDKLQGDRFCTLLLYLNEGMIGGETAFPRYVNGETFHELKVKPEIGKAVLFYSQLPDGNLDDFSQHSAKPLIQGEKWLINLWIADPMRDTYP